MRLALVTLLFLFPSTAAFQARSSRSRRSASPPHPPQGQQQHGSGRSQSSRSSNTALGPVVLGKGDNASPLSYSEQSRKYRRDFFTHDSWLRHRSKDRFVGTLIKIFDSGVVRALAEELYLVGFDDINLIHHDPIVPSGKTFPLMWLPLEGFTLCSPALSLLLIFKTNTSYQRWDEARKAWGAMVNNSRTVSRETSAWIHAADIPQHEKLRLTRRIADAVWLFPRTMQTHLLNPAEDADAYAAAVRRKLPDQELAEDLIAARHKPTLALYELSCAINEIPLDTVQRSTIDTAVSQLCDALGACDRIFSSPVPVKYTRFAARFVELFMLFAPLAMYKGFGGFWNHWPLIPISMLLGFFFLGIEELAIQLEEPFSVLPLAQIASTVGLSADEHYQWMKWTMSQEEDVNGEGTDGFGFL